jgi:hypothetical protein
MIEILAIITNIRGFHITDDPRIVLTALRQRLPLDREQDVSLADDLFASGLYFKAMISVKLASDSWPESEASLYNGGGKLDRSMR